MHGAKRRKLDLGSPSESRRAEVRAGASARGGALRLLEVQVGAAEDGCEEWGDPRVPLFLSVIQQGVS